MSQNTVEEHAHRGHEHADRPRDQGAILVLALVLSVVMSIIVLALAQYSSTGLRTSRVSTERTERTAASTAAVYFTIEQIAMSSPLTCPANSTLPGAANPGDVGVTITCVELTPGVPPARFEIVAMTDDGHPAGVVTAIVDVRDEMSPPRSVRVADWVSGN
jgi:Tfp pilus assembly protein PilX